MFSNLPRVITIAIVKPQPEGSQPPNPDGFGPKNLAQREIKGPNCGRQNGRRRGLLIKENLPSTLDVVHVLQKETPRSLRFASH